jgi:hypothetical protein
MRLVQPTCRVKFAAEDIDFVLATLGKQLGTAECLVRLLSDEESRDLILDDDALFHALLEKGGCLRVSTQFYFYILVRHVLRRSNIKDRRVADYVAEVLSDFARSEAVRCELPGQGDATTYLFEMLTAASAADDLTAFRIRAHIGNYTLFLSGVFPERIRARAEARGFPGLSYYEGVGRAQYRIAGDHRLAQRYELTTILHTLSDRFQTMRLALNDIADRLFALGDNSEQIGLLLTPPGESHDGRSE